MNTQTSDEEKDDEDETCIANDTVRETQPLKLSAAIQMATDLKTWALANGHSNILNLTMSLNDSLNDLILDGQTLRQKTISDFFSKKQYSIIIVNIHVHILFMLQLTKTSNNK